MLDTAKRKAMLRQMVLLRAFEEKLEELYQRKAMYGSTHSYRGQEAIAVGRVFSLAADRFDRQLSSRHRPFDRQGRGLVHPSLRMHGSRRGIFQGARRQDAHGRYGVWLSRQYRHRRWHRADRDRRGVIGQNPRF